MNYRRSTIDQSIVRKKHTIYDESFIKEARLKVSLGSGTFGSVALYETEDGERVIKKTKKHQYKGSYPMDFINELDALTKFSFLPHVVDYVGLAFGEESQAGYIIMNKCDTTLSAWKKMNTSFEHRIAQLEPLMRQVGEALVLMHSMGFVHGDLKANNILINFIGQLPNDVDEYLDAGSSTESSSERSIKHDPMSFLTTRVVNIKDLSKYSSGEDLTSSSERSVYLPERYGPDTDHTGDEDIISLDSTKLVFYLADFGFTAYCRGYPNEIKYTGIQKVRPPSNRNMYTSEYWAFMVTCIELITGRGIIKITHKDTKSDIARKMSSFYRRYTTDGVFRLKDFLADELLPDERDDLRLRMIPDSFWKFFEPVLINKKASILDGFNNCGWTVNFDILKQGRFRVRRQSMHDSMKHVKEDYDEWFNHDPLDKEFRARTEDLLNSFLHAFDDDQVKKFNVNPMNGGIKKLNAITVKHYGEVAFILINGEEHRDRDNYYYFKSKEKYCTFERHFLQMVQYQINILDNRP